MTDVRWPGIRSKPRLFVSMQDGNNSDFMILSLPSFWVYGIGTCASAAHLLVLSSTLDFDDLGAVFIIIWSKCTQKLKISYQISAISLLWVGNNTCFYLMWKQFHEIQCCNNTMQLREVQSILVLFLQVISYFLHIYHTKQV